MFGRLKEEASVKPSQRRFVESRTMDLLGQRTLEPDFRVKKSRPDASEEMRPLLMR